MTAQRAIRYRPLVATDEPFLWEMLYEAIYVPAGEPPPPREIVSMPALAQYAAGFGRPGDLGVLAANHGGTPIGAAWLRLLPDGYGYVDEDTPELTMAVVPGYRGRGVGSGLLERLLDWAGGRYLAVSLSVHAGNRAEALYRRFGFEEVGAGGATRTLRKALAQPVRSGG
jgi:GNAT superfamily N-acetyltransferase